MDNFYNIEIIDDNFIEMLSSSSRTLCYRMNYKDLKSGKYDNKITNPFIVYILHAKNYDGKDYLYIGKSKNGILNRPKSHERDDIDWDMCYVLTQFREHTILNDGTILYLEDQITCKAKETNCYNIETHQTTKGTANALDERNCKHFLIEALEMLYILGLDLRTIRSLIKDNQIIGTQELLVNQLFSGAYLSMGENLGHEITNIFKDDSGMYNLFVSPNGTVENHNVNTILFIKNDNRSNVVEVMAMATDLKSYNNEFFTYNGKTYKEIYNGNQFNDQIEDNKNILMTYRTNNVQMPVYPLYIGVKDLITDSNVELIDNNGIRLTNTSMRSYHKEDSNLYKQFKTIIDKTAWKPLDTEEFYQRFNKYDSFKQQYERFISRINLTINDNAQVINQTKKKKSHFTFELLNIPIGSELCYTLDHTIKCVVVDNNNKIEFNGEIMTLTMAAKILLDKKDANGKYLTVSGPTMFTYNGKILTELRKELENR